MSVYAVDKANIRTARERRLAELEVDTPGALDARVVIKPDNKCVGRDIREREISDSAIKRDRVSVANIELTGSKTGIRNFSNICPAHVVECGSNFR